jgi:hypothetical protein
MKIMKTKLLKIGLIVSIAFIGIMYSNIRTYAGETSLDTTDCKKKSTAVTFNENGYTIHSCDCKQSATGVASGRECKNTVGT